MKKNNPILNKSVILLIALLSFLISPVFSENKPPAVPDSLTLEQAIDFAFQNNTDIKTQEQNIKIAEALYIQARSNVLPQVNLTIQPEHYSNTGATRGSGSTGDEYPVKIELTQPVYAFGKFFKGMDAVKYYTESQKALLEQSKQSVSYQVSSTFYNILLQEELVRVDEEALTTAEEHLRVAQIRFDQGVNTQFDVTRAKVDVANRKPDLISAKKNLIRARQNFNQLLNLPPSTEIQLNGKLEYQEYIPDIKTAWEIAQKNRPDLKSQNNTVLQNEAVLKLRKVSYLPNISVGADYTAEYAKYSGYNSNTFNSWDAYVKLTMPIFDGFNIAGQIKEAKATLEQSKLSYESLLLSAQVNVEQTVLEINKQKELVAAAKETIDLAELSLRMAKISYENGKATTLDVSDAELSLTTAKSNWAQAVYNYLVALANLKQVLGVAELPT